ncbi:hypothetical protein ONZ45_g113 [Pleurotus djamor]|nr:hypothetical protein ONZ45_g113 [Pleurotus djamor]
MHDRLDASKFSYFLLLCLLGIVFTLLGQLYRPSVVHFTLPVLRSSVERDTRFCASIKHHDPANIAPFDDRKESDRYDPKANATIIKNAVIWTGRYNGTQIISGSILIDKGVIQRIGKIPDRFITDNTVVIDARGRWVTPGLGSYLFDIHSHLGLLSAPFVPEFNDVKSRWGTIAPWLRVADAFNTHDESLRLTVAGGVSTVQVSPGNSDAMGGEAYMAKLRITEERTPTSMLVEPPCRFNGTGPCKDFRWRHLKLSCGEEARNGGSRMDTIWALRSALNQARQMKFEQEAYCSDGDMPSSVRYTDDFQWQILLDAMRGGVKTTVHCHDATDIDAMIRLSNEFQFPIHSFAGASEAYLISSVLNRTWQSEPTIALSSRRHRSRLETYRASEYAAPLLARAGLPVAFKSDHPRTNSRYLLYEAQHAHHYGLPMNLALMAVTSVPANAVGLGHRLGTLFEGADADIVLWDAHPLQLGATPVNVWIDGVPQFKDKVSSGLEKGEEWNEYPKPPIWSNEMEETLRWDGLPPLYPKKLTKKISFGNVKEVWTRSRRGDIEVKYPSGFPDDDEVANVVIDNGKITCIGSSLACLGSRGASADIDLKGGSISPSFLTFGSTIGLEEIVSEPTTGDGRLYDAFTRDIPSILGDVGGIVRAMDALAFSSRNALMAYRSGVTLATSSLMKATFAQGSPVIAGLSTTFRTGFPHAMEQGAIVQTVTALHVRLGKPAPFASGASVAVSEQIAGLRRLLTGWVDERTETGQWFRQASEGVIPLVVEVHSADIMAALLMMKTEIEDRKGSFMRLIFSGATEAHLLAHEISRASVGVILSPSRPFPSTWEDRRILPGPPLSNDTAIFKLVDAGVKVGIGIKDPWDARDTRFEVSMAAKESRGRIGLRQAHAFASTNLEQMLGVWPADSEHGDLVVYSGGSATELSSKVVAVISQQRGQVELLTRQAMDKVSLADDLSKLGLPHPDDYPHIRHLDLHPSSSLSDETLATILSSCPHLETATLSGVPEITDRTLILLAETASRLQGLGLSNCRNITDVGILELAMKSLPLQWIHLNGVLCLTDPSISAIARTCAKLLDLDLRDLPLLTPVSVRDVWTYSRKLRSLHLARCPLLTDKAFPSHLGSDEDSSSLHGDKPLPPRPTTWIDKLPPLILAHSAENLRLLDLAFCDKITDEAIEGIVVHAPRIQNLTLTGCTKLTDKAVEHICLLMDNLDVLSLAHVSNITDAAIVKLARSCPNLRSVDLAFCRNLTDMSIFELAMLIGLRRLSLVRCHKLTDIAIYTLAEHAAFLESLRISYCDRLSLEAIHLLLKRLRHLQHVTATGVPSLRRKGTHRFSEPPPASYNADQQAAYRVFSGDNVMQLCRFLDKEERRRRDSEAKNIPFTERSDDEMALY